MKLILVAGLALPLAMPSGAVAAPIILALTPGNMLAQTHSRAMMIATTATFRQLSGTLRYDPATGACTMDVTFVVLSLQLPNALLRSKTMSDDFLDPAQYPLQRYVGTCQTAPAGGTMLAGALTMHGQTHPFNMAVTFDRSGAAATAMHTTGTLNRFDWGVSGSPMLAGKMIHITNDISLNGQPPHSQ